MNNPNTMGDPRGPPIFYEETIVSAYKKRKIHGLEKKL